MAPPKLPSPGTRETVAFITGALAALGKPAAETRILEVGCGSGEVALELARQGLQVTAIDASPEEAAKARAIGVPAIEIDFLRYEPGEAGPFDAVVFTRSLHHIQSLDEALARAFEVMRLGGLLIVEEFALESIDRPTARWLYSLGDMLALLGVHPRHAHAHAHAPRAEHAEHAEHADPLDRWNEDHGGEHHLHRGDAMLTSVYRRFELVEVSSSPYLYRALGARFDPGEQGDRIRELLFAWEQTAITEGTLHAVGLRFIAQKPDPDAAHPMI